MDNTSDHDPVFMQMSVVVQRLNTLGRPFAPRVAWHKAKSNELSAYAACLNEDLEKINIPRHCVECNNVNCNDDNHVYAFEEYLRNISEARLNSAARSVPCTAPRSNSGRIAGWDEAVHPARQKSLFGTIYGRTV